MRLLLTIAWLAGILYASIPLFWFAVHPFIHTWRARRGSIYPILGLLWLSEWMLVGRLTAPYRALRLYSSPWAWLLWVLFAGFGLSVYLRIGGAFGAHRLIGREELRPAAGSPATAHSTAPLVTTGMHARLRHPIYLAHLCSLTGWALGSGLTVLYGFWLFAVLTGAMMVRMEERELLARFGDQYREYQRRVPMLLPRARLGG